MRKSLLVVFGVVMFALGAYSAPSAQRTADENVPYLPQLPQVGQQIEFGSTGRCQVVRVAREWVKCSEVPQWRNVYNGQMYSLHPLTD